jgi:hypothetical protein
MFVSFKKRRSFITTSAEENPKALLEKIMGHCEKASAPF